MHSFFSLDTTAIHLLWIACLLSLVGIYWLIKGISGRKFDDHSLCGRCRFDLTGLPKDQEQCPECGFDILKPGHVKTGNRQRSPQRIWLAGICLALAVLMVVPSSRYLAQKYRWLNYMPVWFLRIQTQHDTDWCIRSWYQLIHRYERNQLTASQIQLAINDAMTLQADFDRPWMLHAGMIIDRAQEQGDLSLEKWQQYLKTAEDSEMQFEISPQVIHGKPIHCRIIISPLRAGSQMWRTSYLASEIQIPSGKCFWATNVKAGTYSEGVEPYRHYSAFILHLPNVIWQTIEPGRLNLHVKHRGIRSGRSFDENVGQMNKLVPMYPEMDQTIEVLPAQTSSEPLTKEITMETVIQNGLSIPGLFFQKRYHKLRFQIDTNQLCVALAMDLFVELEGESVKLASIAIPSADLTGKGCYQFDVSAKHLDFNRLKQIKTLDITLKPSQTTAEQNMGLTDFWTKPITQTYVPVFVDGD